MILFMLLEMVELMMAIQIKNGNIIWQNNIASISDFGLQQILYIL